MADTTPELPNAEPDAPTSRLTPLVPPQGWTKGKYTWFPVSPEPFYGPDELGEYRSAIDDLTETVNRADSAARNWEILQAWEARNFLRGYHFLQGGRKGWTMYGAVNGGNASGAEIMQSQNAGKLFAVNVYGARADKASSILAMEIPGLTFVPKTDDSANQTAADEKKKYLKVWLNDAGIKQVLKQTSDLFYTDGRVAYLTWSIADEQEWGTETPSQPQETFGPSDPEGVSPETEEQPGQPDSDVPAVREVTWAFGKLECKVPIYADKLSEMGWIRFAKEQNENALKERYPWIADKVKGGSGVGGQDDLSRTARIQTRLAVQQSSSSGESWQQDATESFTFFRPSQYNAIKDKDMREIFRAEFPDGLLVIHAGAELAMVQNRGMNRHVSIAHAREGSGQNRRAIGSNYLPLQKILNAEIGLLDRQMRSWVARRFHDSEAINSEAINGQMGDPAKSTPLVLKPGQTIQGVTGIENVPTANTAMMEFIQWLIEGAPEAMDGMSPSMWGDTTNEGDQGVYQTAKLKRDAARGVYSLPWSSICIALAKAAEQAAECAAENRITDIASNIPGQGKLQVEISKMQGNALCYPESTDIPQTISEQEEQMAQLLANSANVAFYQALVNDPRNLTVFANFPSLSGLEIPGLDSVEQQQGEFELLMQSGPVPNPQFVQIQEHIAAGAQSPESQTPEGQQMMQQLQQQLQQMAPQVSTVPVAQDGSENHMIHAAVTLGMLTSPEGRKLKNGNEQQQQIWQNLKLHWQEHVKMGEQLTPPTPMDFKGSLTVDPSKFSPEIQAKVFQAAGLQVSPEEAQGDQQMVAHEVTTEKEGIGADGVPVKQKIAMINPGGKLN